MSAAEARRSLVAAALAFVAGLLGPFVTTPLAAEIGPESNFCAAAHALPEGEELVLRPGDYRGPCTLRRGGQPGAPLVIRALDPANRPRIVYADARSNALNVRADHVTIRGLSFGPTRHAIDGVKIYSAADVTVEDCEFVEMGGIAVSANHHSIEGLVVRRNAIRDSRATAMYFGCHDGRACAVTGLVVEGNLIRGVTAPDPEIGYGVQVKLNSSGIIRGNVIMDTKGPGIMVYGATGATPPTTVERNIVSGSRLSSGIVIGGGPAIVRNNVSTANAQAGIELTDYHGRRLLRDVSVLYNTVYQAGDAGITAPRDGLQDVTLGYNAVRVRERGEPLPSARPGLALLGNADCRRDDCFVRPEAWDFSPGARLRGAAEPPPRPLAGAPTDDFTGRPRGRVATAGAIDGPWRPLTLDPRAAREMERGQ